MIDTLAALPALTYSWIAPLEHDDPELYAELAEQLVVVAPGSATERPFPAGVAPVLEALDLRNKEIGAFRFAPAPGEGAADMIAAYDQKVRRQFDTPAELVFVGDYGSGSLFASPEGIGLFDADRDRIVMFAPDFATFLLVQANAYDAYKRHIVKNRDRTAYQSDLDRTAAIHRFVGADVAAVFEAQLSG